jgi:hypothetical protein
MNQFYVMPCLCINAVLRVRKSEDKVDLPSYGSYLTTQEDETSSSFGFLYLLWFIVGHQPHKSKVEA